MSDDPKRYAGGCLCGALRYEAVGEPLFTGHCYCTDCRKASGSGFIPFMGFARDAVRFSGEARQFVSKAANGGDAVRNSCPICSSLVFGGKIGEPELFHDLRRLARRPVVFPSQGRDLRPQPSGLGGHPAGPHGFRRNAAGRSSFSKLIAP